MHRTTLSHRARRLAAMSAASLALIALYPSGAGAAPTPVPTREGPLTLTILEDVLRDATGGPRTEPDQLAVPEPVAAVQWDCPGPGVDPPLPHNPLCDVFGAPIGPFPPDPFPSVP
jgi:hypothetical protein